jgi:hypothetical protein
MCRKELAGSLPLPVFIFFRSGDIMRNISIKLAILLTIQGMSLAHASDVNVGVSISGQIQPGVYGRVDIGNTPPPLVYQQPVIIVPQPQRVQVAPLYLHVPPGHAKNWGKHCHKYNACNQPVYFVRSQEYGPGDYHDRYHDKHHEKHGHGHGHDD